jgi:hypothetical protein
MIDWVVDVGLDSKVSAIERRVFNLTSIHMRTHTGAQRRAGALIRADRRPSGYPALYRPDQERRTRRNGRRHTESRRKYPFSQVTV